MQIELIESPSTELMDFFEKRIEEFNLARWDVKKKIPIAVRIVSEGRTVGGASAKTFGNWLLIENIWVSEELRGAGSGSKILAALEDGARARGCKFALLDTLDFQARPFYERFGYRVAWTQNEYPRTGCKHHMIKEL